MQFNVGTIYHFVNCSVCIPTKNKYAICVCSQENLFYFINSVDERRPYKHEVESVLYLDEKDVGCLKHRSYINVSAIKVITTNDYEKCSKELLLSNMVWLALKSKVAQDKKLLRKYKEIINNSIKCNK